MPRRYGARHPGLEHSWLYPRIDTAPPPARRPESSGRAATRRQGSGRPAAAMPTATPRSGRDDELVELVGSATLVTLLAPLPVGPGRGPSTTGTVREPASVHGEPGPAGTPSRRDRRRSRALMGTRIREATSGALARCPDPSGREYIDTDAATASRWPRFKRQAPSKLRQDARFGRRLLDLGFGMALRWVMTRSVVRRSCRRSLRRRAAADACCARIESADGIRCPSFVRLTSCRRPRLDVRSPAYARFHRRQ